MTRNMRAEGAAVVEWFAQRSLVATPVSQGSPVLIVDESEVAGVVVRRLWHTALTIEPAPSSRKGSTLVLQAEGSVGFGLAGCAVHLEAGDALVYPDADFVGVRATRPTARIEVASAHRLLEESAQLPGADDGPVWRALASTVNSILNGDHRLGVHAESALGRAIESLCTALIAGRAGADAEASGFRSAQATFAAATRLLTERAPDPRFTVEELADALDVSRQYLARVFARHGHTASAALRARRLELADALGASGLPPDEVARRSGFPSARALSRARRERDLRT
ncbi:AraC family transcriptional regulator [Microbacterium sp. NPDC086615]|uniref:helix-turn-helix domain-containing protein n=1 Tax=Microbacterium sp. NPDC086615 TaxID=3154865 RepID=UPI003448472A